MSKFSKQLDYLVTSLVLMGTGLLFLFLNRGLNTYSALHFSLLQICQSVLLLIMAALSIYGEGKRPPSPRRIRRLATEKRTP